MTTIDQLIHQLNTAFAALQAAGVRIHPAPINEDGTLEPIRSAHIPTSAPTSASCLHCYSQIPLGNAWCDDTCRKGRLLRDADREPLLIHCLYTDREGAIWRMDSSYDMWLAYRPGQEEPLDPEPGIISAAELVREMGPLAAQGEHRWCRRRDCRNEVLQGQTACSRACLSA